MTAAYLDNAASTRPASEVLEVMSRVAIEQFANPSAAHAAGAAAARELEAARQVVATALGVAAGEIVFTAGGTEANALGILGAAGIARGRHLVISAIEHSAVLRNALRLAKDEGFDVTTVPVGVSGVVQPQDVAAAMRADTAVVAVMLVNNELGTVQPVAEIARALHARAHEFTTGRLKRPHFHVDAVQAFGVI